MKIIFCRRSAQAAALLLALQIFVGACSHAPSSSSAASHGDQSVPPLMRVYSLHQLVPYTLKIRRPSTPGIDPKVGPGGVDYKASATPDAQFDCRDAAWLFREVNLAELRKCVSISGEKTFRAFYVLRREAVPYLELEQEEDTLPCLVKLLPKIAVPREILFQSTEGGRLACYSSRLALESDELAGFKMPMDRKGVRLDFPLLGNPHDDAETRMLLLTWALTPFWSLPSGGTLASYLVPDHICRQCLGPKTMLKPTDPEPILWPAGE